MPPPPLLPLFRFTLPPTRKPSSFPLLRLQNSTLVSWGGENGEGFKDEAWVLPLQKAPAAAPVETETGGVMGETHQIPAWDLLKVNQHDLKETPHVRAYHSAVVWGDVLTGGDFMVVFGGVWCHQPQPQPHCNPLLNPTPPLQVR